MKVNKETAKKQVEEKKEKDRSGISIVRCPTFQKTYGTRALVTRTEFDFRVVIANEKMLSNDGKELFIGESQIILTPTAAKELSKQMVASIEEWETEYGRIKKRPSESKYSEQSLSP